MGKEMNELQQREFLIHSLGVFELRALARELGIASPTTKKREELISLIFDILKDGSQMKIKAHKRGRPFKKLSSVDAIVSSVQSIPKQEEATISGVVTFMQEEASFNTFCGNTTTFEGFVRIAKDGRLCLFDVDAWASAYIPDNIYGIEQLKLGAKVKISASLNSNDNYYEATAILEIEGVKFQDLANTEVELGDEVIGYNDIKFGNLTAKEGRRNVYSFDEELFEDDKFKSLVNFCEDNDYQLKVLSIDTPYENQVLFKSLDIQDTFITNYGDNDGEGINKVVDVANHAKYQTELGKKVVVFVPDVITVLRKVDEFIKKSHSENKELVCQNGRSEFAIIVMQNLLSIAKAYSNGYSTTLIMGYNKIDEDDKFLTTDIFKISKKLN